MRPHRWPDTSGPAGVDGHERERLSLSWRLRESGCASCAAQREAETNALSWFLRENHREPATLHKLIDSRYCLRHLTALLAKREPKLSVTMSFLVREEVGAVRRFRADLVRRRWAPWHRSNGNERRLPRGASPADERIRCPLCASGAVAATVATGEVLSLLETDEGRRAYTACDGFCGPHAWAGMRDAVKPIADWLACDFEKRLNAASTALDGYVAYQRGADHAYASSYAWLAAVRLVWGEHAAPAGKPHDDTATI